MPRLGEVASLNSSLHVFYLQDTEIQFYKVTRRLLFIIFNHWNPGWSPVAGLPENPQPTGNDPPHSRPWLSG